MRDSSSGSLSRRTGDTVTIPGDYQHRARNEGFVVQRFWHAEKERIIRKYSPPATGDRVLDIGCGSGVIADFLASFGARVTGVDASEMAIAYAQRTFVRRNLDFRLGLVDEIAFDDSSVDRVYCFELLEHLYEPQIGQLLDRLSKWTRAGGVLTLTTPNYHGLWPLIEYALDRFRLVPTLAQEQHVTKFHRSRLIAILQASGWHVTRLTTFSTFAPFVSMLGWQLATRCARVEDRLALPFGNILFAQAVRL